MTATDMIAASYRMSAAFFHRMVDDLTSEEFSRQPVPGSNCAAWVVGHLALTMRNAARRMGVTNLPEIDDSVVSVLRTTKEAAGEQTGCGDPRAMLAVFDVCVERFIEAVKAMPVESLAGEPLVAIPLAKNRGDALLFGSLHIAMHAGQVSTIRRSIGKPPIV